MVMGKSKRTRCSSGCESGSRSSLKIGSILCDTNRHRWSTRCRPARARRITSPPPGPPARLMRIRFRGPADGCAGAGAGVLVVVEDVVAVISGLHVHQPVIDGVAGGLAGSPPRKLT